MTSRAIQEKSFSQRLERIANGSQFEHEELVGSQTYRALKEKNARKPKRKRSLRDQLMVPVAFALGCCSAVIGRLAYLTVVTFDGLPPAVYKLEDKGIYLAMLLTALMIIVTFRFFSLSRVQYLALGCVVMVFGEGGMVKHLPEVYKQMPVSYVQSVEASAAALNAA